MTKLPRPADHPVGTYVVVDGWVHERDVVDGQPRWRNVARHESTSGLLRRKLDAQSEPARGGGEGRGE